jgi:hypothetical protein
MHGSSYGTWWDASDFLGGARGSGGKGSTATARALSSWTWSFAGAAVDRRTAGPARGDRWRGPYRPGRPPTSAPRRPGQVLPAAAALPASYSCSCSAARRSPKAARDSRASGQLMALAFLACRIYRDGQRLLNHLLLH